MCVVGPQAAPVPPNTVPYSPKVRRHLALRGEQPLPRPELQHQNRSNRANRDQGKGIRSLAREADRYLGHR